MVRVKIYKNFNVRKQHQNAIILIGIILFYNISIVHARSRAPAWSCLIATKITRRKFVTTFHGTYNYKNKLKKFYNSVMVRSDLIIAGSNFIFSHIKENYAEYLTDRKKLLSKNNIFYSDFVFGSSL